MLGSIVNGEKHSVNENKYTQMWRALNKCVLYTKKYWNHITHKCNKCRHLEIELYILSNLSYMSLMS